MLPNNLPDVLMWKINHNCLNSFIQLSNFPYKHLDFESNLKFIGHTSPSLCCTAVLFGLFSEAMAEIDLISLKCDVSLLSP